MDLVHGGRDVRGLERLVEIAERVVADADRSRQPARGDRLHLPPGREEQPWRWEVHEVQIDVVETEPSEAPLERPLCPEGFEGEELRGDPDLLAWDAACADRLADASLVSIQPCGVDVSDPGVERPVDGLLHGNVRQGSATPRGLARGWRGHPRAPFASRGPAASRGRRARLARRSRLP